MNLSEYRDGMEAPDVGGPVLTQRRRQAIRALLELMGCTHRRGDNCDHVDAVRELSEVTVHTTMAQLVPAIRALPRPLAIRDIERLEASFVMVTMLPEPTEERRNDARTE